MRRPVHPADHLLLLAPDHGLTHGQSAGIDAHVAACAACRARRARLQRVLGVVSPQPDAQDAASVTSHAAARQRLQSALRREASTASGWRTYEGRIRTVAGAPLALAAIVLLMALALQVPGLTPVGAVPLEAERQARPVPVFTPGAASSLGASALCAGARPSRLVAAEARDQVLVEYGMQAAPADTYELDALITPELGGTTARANLWPQRYDTVWNARVKDQLESLLADRVCSGRMQLGDAQEALARDWVASYKQAFETDAPLPSHLASTEVDEELTVVESAHPTRRTRVLATAGPMRLLRLIEPPAQAQAGSRRAVRVALASWAGTTLPQS